MREWINFLQEEQIEFDEIDVANFKKRNYAHLRDESISCRVRIEEFEKAKEKSRTLANPLRNFIRHHLMDNKEMLKEFVKEAGKMRDEDYLKLIGLTKKEYEELDNRKQFLFSQIVSYMSSVEARALLDLDKVIATKLAGYEKEIFVLRCLARGTLAVISLRIAIRMIGNGYVFTEHEVIPLSELL